MTGQQITNIRTMGSKFDEGRFVLLEDDCGVEHRIDVKEFLKVLNDDVVFEATKKKIHSYLTIRG